MKFIKWRSINKFSDAYSLANRHGHTAVVYRPKIKLHGTNAGIHIENGDVKAQKRTSYIEPGKGDNAGFAAFVNSLDINPAIDCVVYGEWAGPGVQKTDAVSSIDDKKFFIFAVLLLNEDEMITCPIAIEKFADIVFGEAVGESVFVLPWYKERQDNFLITSPEQSQIFIDSIMNEVDEIGECDPYIKKVFGVEGAGEGLVLYPVMMYDHKDEEVPSMSRMDYMFKAKSAAHSVNKTKRRAVIPQKPEGIDEFISMFFTLERFEQMMNDNNIEPTTKNTGEFLKAVMSDAHKESIEEIAVADFEWKDVPKYAVPTVKAWWFDRCNQL